MDPIKKVVSSDAGKAAATAMVYIVQVEVNMVYLDVEEIRQMVL